MILFFFFMKKSVLERYLHSNYSQSENFKKYNPSLVRRMVRGRGSGSGRGRGSGSGRGFRAMELYKPKA